MTYKITQTESFTKWLKDQRNLQARTKIAQRFRRIDLGGNFGDYKSVGDGISELRIDAYRVYYTLRSKKMILLVGGVKDTQQADIKKAKTMLKSLE